MKRCQIPMFGGRNGVRPRFKGTGRTGKGIGRERGAAEKGTFYFMAKTMMSRWEPEKGTFYFLTGKGVRNLQQGG